MLTVKMLRDDDGDGRSEEAFFEAKNVKFNPGTDKPEEGFPNGRLPQITILTSHNVPMLFCEGHFYIMNDTGKTIAQYKLELGNPATPGSTPRVSRPKGGD